MRQNLRSSLSQRFVFLSALQDKLAVQTVFLDAAERGLQEAAATVASLQQHKAELERSQQEQAAAFATKEASLQRQLAEAQQGEPVLWDLVAKRRAPAKSSLVCSLC